MKFLLTGLMLIIAATSATAQEPMYGFREGLLSSFDTVPASVPDPMGASFGFRGGFFKPRDADNGTWFGGVQVRIPLALSFAIEGSIEFHKTEFADGDATVVQYPVQATVLFFLMPGSKIDPYLLGGFGWYNTRIHFSGLLAGADDETDSTFGAHLGFGADFALSPTMTLSADFRYIFLSPNSSALDDEKFDTLQFTVALNFPI